MSKICQKCQNKMSNMCQKYVKNMSKKCWKYVKHMLKICQTYVKHMSKICQKYDKNMSSICKKYVKHIPKISHKYPNKYPKNIPSISQKYPKHIPQISPTYPKHIPKIAKTYPKNIKHIKIKWRCVDRPNRVWLCDSAREGFEASLPQDIWSCILEGSLPHAETPPRRHARQARRNEPARLDRRRPSDCPRSTTPHMSYPRSSKPYTSLARNLHKTMFIFIVVCCVACAFLFLRFNVEAGVCIAPTVASMHQAASLGIQRCLEVGQKIILHLLAPSCSNAWRGILPGIELIQLHACWRRQPIIDVGQDAAVRILKNNWIRAQ